MKKLFLEFLEMDDNDIWYALDSNHQSKRYDSLINLIYPKNKKEIKKHKINAFRNMKSLRYYRE